MPPPFRADQIGSLLRPAELLEARADLAAPSKMYDVPSDEKILQAEKKAIEWAVRRQVDLSIKPIVSGEYNRHIFYSGIFEKLEGMTIEHELPIPDAFRTDFPTTTKLAQMGAKTRPAVIATGPIRWKQSAYMDEWKMLRSSLPKSQWKNCKITLPATSYQHFPLKSGIAYYKESGYADDEQYFEDLGKAYAAEIKALYDEGCRNIQIDDPNLTYFCSTQFLEGCKKDGTDTEALLDLYLRTHNMFLKDRPGHDLHIGTHLCRGNMSHSTHFASGSYENIAEKLFTMTDYDTYFFEFDDAERQGGFEPLRFLPKGKNVVLGVVSTKRAGLESVDRSKVQVGEAAEIIAKAQGVTVEEAKDCLAVSPQCGFSSSSLAGGKDMTMDRMWEKLVLVRNAARQIWTDAV